MLAATYVAALKGWVSGEVIEGGLRFMTGSTSRRRGKGVYLRSSNDQMSGFLYLVYLSLIVRNLLGLKLFS